ncbi:hypothetical protein CPB85DRAFT_1427997 [Mucidula mucida]|nr:hypothetical protein CPB85DRAFT_1427997 [Mucidula mucida]
MSGSLPNFTNTVIDHGRIHLKKLLGAGSFGAVYEVDIQTACPLQYAVKVMFTPAPGSYEEELQSAESNYTSAFLTTTTSSPSMNTSSKPENILTSRDGSRVYLADFGLSTKDRASTEFGVGTLPYMSPECIRSSTLLLPTIQRYLRRVGDPLTERTRRSQLYRKTMPIRISAECNELFQCIFQVEPLRRISLSRLLLLIEQVDTFFLEPRIELPLPPPPATRRRFDADDIAITGISPPTRSG